MFACSPFKYAFLSLLLLLSFLHAMAQGKGVQGILTTENDFLAPDNRDENYTGSLKIELRFGELLPWLPFFKFKAPGQSLTIQRAGIGGTAYTPQDLTATAPLTDDRPYASLMFVNIGNTSYDLAKGTVLESELVLGLVGTSLPGNAQSYIHRHHWLGTDRPVPMGWDNQIGYHGSFVLNYNFRIEHPVFPGLLSGANCRWLQLRLRAAVELGSYTTNLRAGFKINILNLNAGLMQDYSPALPGASLAPLAATAPVIRMNVFAGPELRVVGYNTTLEGLMFADHSTYKIPHSDINRLAFDLSAGVNLLLFDRFLLRYALYGRSQEYSGGKKFHSWGGISLGYSPARWNR